MNIYIILRNIFVNRAKISTLLRKMRQNQRLFSNFDADFWRGEAPEKSRLHTAYVTVHDSLTPFPYRQDYYTSSQGESKRQSLPKKSHLHADFLVDTA